MHPFPRSLHPTGGSVSRNFLSEIADFSRIYRQIRQVFGPKSRKIRQFLAIYRKKFMNKNAIKFEILGVRGLNIMQKKAKSGEFSAILCQKSGEFGDKFD